jgi:hypothetical protein
MHDGLNRGTFRSANLGTATGMLLAGLLLVCVQFGFAQGELAEMASPSTTASDTSLADGRSQKVYHVRPGVDYVYTPWRMSRLVTMVPDNIGKYCSVTFRKKNILPIAAMAVGTGVLIALDQSIDDGAKHIAKQWGLKPTEHQHPILRPSVNIKGQNIPLYINVPSDANTAIYFLGDGIVHLGTAAGFGVYGSIAGDGRALHTSAQLVEAIATTGFVVQLLKHATGRESPAKHTVPGGKWRLLPNPQEYGRQVPKYDAWPTGHLATAMATVTVIADNYPEWTLARPIGYTLMAACGFAMLNNGVHWASDYPFGISLGYTMAKIAEASGRLVTTDVSGDEKSSKESTWDSIRFQPVLQGNTFCYGLVCQF